MTEYGNTVGSRSDLSELTPYRLDPRIYAWVKIEMIYLYKTLAPSKWSGEGIVKINWKQLNHQLSDVGSAHPGAGEGPKGWSVRPLKRYVSWVQTVVRQVGLYPLPALEFWEELLLVREDRSEPTPSVSVVAVRRIAE